MLVDMDRNTRSLNERARAWARMLVWIGAPILSWLLVLLLVWAIARMA